MQIYNDDIKQGKPKLRLGTHGTKEFQLGPGYLHYIVDFNLDTNVHTTSGRYELCIETSSDSIHSTHISYIILLCSTH